MRHVKTITIDQLKPGMFIVEMDQPWYRTPFLFHKRLIRHTKDIDLLRQHGIRELKIDPSQGLDVEPVLSGDAPPSSQTQEIAATPQPRLAVPPAASNKSQQPVSDAEKKAAQPHGMQQDAPAPFNTQETATIPKPSHRVESSSLEKAPQLAPDEKRKPIQPQRPSTQQNAPVSFNTQETAAAPNPRLSVEPLSLEKAPHLAPTAERNATQQDTPTPSNAREQTAAAQDTYREATCSVERMFEELEAGIVPRPETLRMVVENVLSRVLDDGASMLSLLSLQKMKRFDRTLASHALDVCTLSLIVAHAYGVAEGELEALGAGALLHDIGYIRLPRNLYRRSHDLTEQDRIMMQQHPTLGLVILRDANEDRNAVVRIVVEHHESINGSGFPHKLKGDAISVLAQLVGLVDIYDGMVSRRGGRPAMLPHDAIRQLFRLGDTGQYAKDLIQAMIGSLGVYPIGSLVLMNTGEQAVVVGMNHTQRLKPVVKVITGPQGGSYLTPIRVDLGAQAAGAPARTITKVLDPLHERVNVAMFLDGIHAEAA
jgi:putative nucleotidyltransferase with HDIG domain